ncbi:hypothetical protein F5882DRAFT_457745 [Hyaloscypha sp. PMI_1271]|nr:hypothetical protein F5882DRAFT_457745 [Hyaloscypha sp. PMI_1271]
MSDNLWASNTTLAQQRGVFLWVGQQNWDTAHNNQTQPFPLLTVLSTLYNETYISTTADGSQDLPCPNSYTYNSDWTMESDYWEGSSYYTYNTSMTCHGFYDLSTSPEYTNVFSVNGFYSNALSVYAFVPSHTNQLLGLGLNSTLLTSLYNAGWIASRSLGLYYGVPSPSEVRNGTLILGGYSTSRLLGNFSAQTYPIGKFTLPKQCPWEVSVSSVAVGGTPIISKPFTACIEPSELSLALPPVSFTGSLPSASANYTITLSNGLAVEIPPDLANTRELTAEDMDSPTLGVPFLSQVYLWADYQTRELHTGLANHSDAYLVGREEIQCVDHGSELGDLGWAVGSSSDVTGTATSRVGKSTGTAKSAGVRRGLDVLH